METVFMRDYSHLDPRSVKAQLRGVGDGREARLESFIKFAKRKCPKATDEAIHEVFRKSEAEREKDMPIALEVFDWIIKSPNPVARFMVFPALTIAISLLLFR